VSDKDIKDEKKDETEVKTTESNPNTENGETKTSGMGEGKYPSFLFTKI
jgi:hypothetical protein